MDIEELVKLSKKIQDVCEDEKIAGKDVLYMKTMNLIIEKFDKEIAYLVKRIESIEKNKNDE